MAASLLVESFASIAPAYDAVLCDVWGVVHNGVAALAPAGDALTRFRAGGGRGRRPIRRQPTPRRSRCRRRLPSPPPRARSS